MLKKKLGGGTAHTHDRGDVSSNHASNASPLAAGDAEGPRSHPGAGSSTSPGKAPAGPASKGRKAQQAHGELPAVVKRTSATDHVPPTGAAKSGAGTGLKPSLKAGLPRTNRTTGRPVTLASSQGDTADGSGPAGGDAASGGSTPRGGSSSPDRMPRRLRPVAPAAGGADSPRGAVAAAGAAASVLPSVQRATSSAVLAAIGSLPIAHDLQHSSHAPGPPGLGSSLSKAALRLSQSQRQRTIRLSSIKHPAGASTGDSGAPAPDASSSPGSLRSPRNIRTSAATLPGSSPLRSSATAIPTDPQLPHQSQSQQPQQPGSPERGAATVTPPGGMRGNSSQTAGRPGSVQQRGQSPLSGSAAGSKPGSPSRRSPGAAPGSRGGRGGANLQRGASTASSYSRFAGATYIKYNADPAGLFELLAAGPGSIGRVEFSKELWCMDTWKVLEGSCKQQRAWTFGIATIPPLAVAAAAAEGAAGNGNSGGAGAAGSAPGGLGGLPLPHHRHSQHQQHRRGRGITYTSHHPLALVNGVVMVRVAAGKPFLHGIPFGPREHWKTCFCALMSPILVCRNRFVCTHRRICIQPTALPSPVLHPPFRPQPQGPTTARLWAATACCTCGAATRGGSWDWAGPAASTWRVGLCSFLKRLLCYWHTMCYCCIILIMLRCQLLCDVFFARTGIPNHPVACLVLLSSLQATSCPTR